MEPLTHVRADGSAHMVDVTAKPVTARWARARALVRTRPDVIDRIVEGDMPKGEVLSTARLAGIMGAKRTSELIPLCHPLPLTGIEVDLRAEGDAVRITAEVRTSAVTGVEMEALTAVTSAALTVIDMIKAVDHLATIDGVQVLAKSGGKSGDWDRDREGGRKAAAGTPVEADTAETAAAETAAAQTAPAETATAERTQAPAGGGARVLVASTRAAQGAYEDRTGPLLTDWLRGRGLETPAPAVVADGPRIGQALLAMLAERPALIVTTGGTGISPTDATPEQTAPLLDRELPGIAEALRRSGAEDTPLAALGRGLVGMAGDTLVVNLPGSPGGVRDGIAVLDPLLDHLLDQREGEGHA